MKLQTALAIGLSCLANGTGADLDAGRRPGDAAAPRKRKLRGRSSRDLLSNDLNVVEQLLTFGDGAEDASTATTPPTEVAIAAVAPRTVCSSIIAVSAAYSPNATYTDLAGHVVPHGDDDATTIGGDVELDYAELEADANERASSTNEEFLCELPAGIALPINGEADQIVELRTMLNKGDIISGETGIEVERDESGMTGLMDTSTSVTLPSGGIRLVQSGGDGRRKLKTKEKYEGVKKILVVRVIDKKGRAPSGNAKVRVGKRQEVAGRLREGSNRL